MNYFPPFDVIRRSVDIQAVRGDLLINVSYEEFVELLKLMIRGIAVDEEWYARTYDDIGHATFSLGRSPDRASVAFDPLRG